jgi:hypothetical protein
LAAARRLAPSPLPVPLNFGIFVDDDEESGMGLA